MWHIKEERYMFVIKIKKKLFWPIKRFIQRKPLTYHALTTSCYHGWSWTKSKQVFYLYKLSIFKDNLTPFLTE